VLPTSGCRGCTATVVELAFNEDLLFADRGHHSLDSAAAEASVYKAEIEFIDLDAWLDELKVLLDECCGEDGRVLERRPRDKRNKISFRAFQKIDAVYGKGTMEGVKSKKSRHAFRKLSKDPRILERLARPESIEEGRLLRGSTHEFFRPTEDLSPSMRSLRRTWAEALRSRIDRFVYNTGNEDGPQMWPLIHKVHIKGPWSVLSSGACLVDLPGLQDSNSVRAKVADEYLKNCDHILVVAKIQRAVSDGAAHRLIDNQVRNDSSSRGALRFDRC
jgi:hypothetical protein